MKIYVDAFVATLIAKFPIVFMVTTFTSIPTVAMFTFIINLQMLLWLLWFFKAFSQNKKGTLAGGQHIRMSLLGAFRDVAKSDN